MAEDSPDDARAATLGRYGPMGHLFLVGVLALAFVGYFVGLRRPQEKAPSDFSPRRVEAQTSVHPSTPYHAIRDGNLGPNAAWQTQLALDAPTVVDLFQVEAGTEQQKAQALILRASRRAFNGAPPTIPHSVDHTSAAACMACHGEGMQVGDVVAPVMAHEFLTNCTQCHVPQQPLDETELTWLQTSFEGLPAPFAGARAGPGAPPTVPHTTLMRSNCLSCHGPSGSAGIRSSHPWRSSCLQCHAPSSALDQRGDVAETTLFLEHDLPRGP